MPCHRHRWFNLLFALLVASCGGGGGTGPGGNGPAVGGVQLSTDSAFPTQILVISDRSIAAGDLVEVGFEPVDGVSTASAVTAVLIAIEPDQDLDIIPVEPNSGSGGGTGADGDTGGNIEIVLVDPGTGTGTGSDAGAGSGAGTGSGTETGTGGGTGTGSAGYRVTVVANFDGRVEVAVPPLFRADGEFRAGQVRVSVDGRAAGQLLSVDAVPELDAPTNGVLLLAYLDDTLDSYRAALANVALIDLEGNGGGVDPSAARAALLQGMDQVQEMRDQLASEGRLTVEGADGAETLGPAELSRLDRWLLLAQLSLQTLVDQQALPAAKLSFPVGRRGVAEYGPGDAGRALREGWESARAALAGLGSDASPTGPGVYDTIRQGLDDSAEATRHGLRTAITTIGGYVGGLAALVGGAAWLAGDTALAGAARALAVAKAYATASGRYFDAWVNQENTDAYLSRDRSRFDAAAEFVSQAARALAAALAEMASSPWNNLFRGASWGLAIKDFLSRHEIDLCASVSSVFCGTGGGGGSGGTGGPIDAGPFTVIGWTNFDGSTGTDPDGADVMIRGILAQPIIGWNGQGISLVVMDAGSNIVYGIAGGLAGGVKPFGFGVRYGDYTFPDTTAEGPQPAPALDPVTEWYVIDVQRLDDMQHAQLWFRVNDTGPGASAIASRFDNDSFSTEGWAIGPRASGVSWTNCGSAEQQPSGGNLGGYLTHTEVCPPFPAIPNDDWYFHAPAAFHGDRSADFGRWLSFDLRAETRPGTDYSTRFLVVLRGAGKYLALLSGAEFVTPTQSTWTRYRVPLSTSDARNRWFTTTSNLLVGTQPATEADLREVLGALDWLAILGSFTSAATDLDNVVLGTD